MAFSAAVLEATAAWMGAYSGTVLSAAVAGVPQALPVAAASLTIDLSATIALSMDGPSAAVLSMPDPLIVAFRMIVPLMSLP
jgi:hypothetical protein